MDTFKKIWVITPNFHPLWAGPSERFFRYAKISKQYGLELSFVTLFREGGFEGDHLEGVPVERFRVNGPAELYEAFSKSLPDRKGALPDACIFLGLTKNLMGINRKLQGLGIKSVYVSTMDFDLENRPNGTPRKFFRKLLYKWYLKALVGSFDVIVSSSSHLSNRYAEDLGISPKKLKVIPNGVDIQRFMAADNNEVAQLRQKLQLPADGLLFLYVGLLVERKGILELLEAWKAYKTEGGAGSLVCLGNEKKEGDSSPEFFQRFEAAKAALTSSDQVMLVPASKEVHQYFKACDVFVFLSKLEGMPNVLLEAMSSSMPILLHRFKGFSSDYGENGRHYIATSLEKAEISQHLHQLSTENTLRENLGLAARQWVEAKFQVAESIKAYRNLVEVDNKGL